MRVQGCRKTLKNKFPAVSAGLLKKFPAFSRLDIQIKSAKTIHLMILYFVDIREENIFYKYIPECQYHTWTEWETLRFLVFELLRG